MMFIMFSETLLFTAADQGALAPGMQGWFFLPCVFRLYQLPVNRFPTQPVPQG